MKNTNKALTLCVMAHIYNHTTYKAEARVTWGDCLNKIPVHSIIYLYMCVLQHAQRSGDKLQEPVPSLHHVCPEG